MADDTVDPHDIHAVGLQFLLTEIAVGLEFSRIAQDAGEDHDKRRRNREHAQSAYDAVVKFAPRVSLSPSESRQLAAQLDELGKAIAAASAGT